MKGKTLKAIYGSPDRPLKIGNLEIPAYVLEDSRRVLVQGGMLKSLNISSGGSRSKGGDRLAKFISGNRLKPFVDKDLLDRTTKPIKFKIKGIVAYGYEAITLPEICDAILEARNNGVLQKQQLHIAEQCEILVRSLSKVGIIALVDEATGYEEIRDKYALQKILDKYISKELAVWAKKFPDEFYKELFRLKKWQYSPISVKRPIYVGKLTNDIVYNRLAPGVLEELKKKNPIIKEKRRKSKHHQWLTEDVGHSRLAEHLSNVVVLMKASANWGIFERLLNRAKPKCGESLMLPMEYEDEKE